MIPARPGEHLKLGVTISDPDGDQVTVRWRRWDEADTYDGAAAPDRAEGPETGLGVPADAKAGETIHLIAEATDDGTPALTRYARIVVRVAAP